MTKQIESQDSGAKGVIAYLRGRRSVLRENEFCGVCNISPKKAQRDRAIGAGPPFIKEQHGIRYLPEDVADWLESRRRRSTTDDGGAT